MKEDAPPPKHPPRKRYQLENAQKVPELWLAVWASDPELSEEERKRVQEERDRRKALKPSRIVGVLVDSQNITPVQRDALKEELSGANPTEVHHPWTSGRVVGVCRSVGVPITTHPSLREVVLESMMVIAAPRGIERVKDRTPAWEAVHYAKHRKLPVIVVLPDGSVLGKETQ